MTKSKKKIRGRGEGSITRRENGRWRAQISRDGKRISFGADTKAEVQEWLRRTLHQIDYGLSIEGSRIHLGDYIQEWLKSNRVSLRAKTAHQYERIIENHILPHLAKVPLRELSQQRVEQFYADLILAGRGVRTVRMVHAVLHKALEKAIQYGLIVRNPAHGAALPRHRQQEMMVLEEGQVSVFLAAASGSRLEALYHLAVVTGMRQGELFGLKWADLQWGSGVIYVQRQVQHVSGQGWSFLEPKTRAGRRPVRIGAGTLDVLRQHKERQDLEQEFVGERWIENGLIFPNGVGNPLDPHNLRKDFLEILEKAGIAPIRFHDLRHTAASLMLNHGVPVMVVSKILGHANPSITLNTYGHLYHESQEVAAKLMDQLVTPVRVEIPEATKKEVPPKKNGR